MINIKHTSSQNKQSKYDIPKIMWKSNISTQTLKHKHLYTLQLYADARYF